MPIERYGLIFSDEFNDLAIELNCFWLSHSTARGGLGKAGHFKEVAKILWGDRHKEFTDKKVLKEFIWHPWADTMLENACEHENLGVIGCASSGKSDFFAIWAIVNWLCHPKKTKVLVTSTSLKESRKRIWGSVREYYMAAAAHIDFEGKIVDSLGQIRFVGGSQDISSDKCGIELIPGEKKKEKEAIGKLIGIKAKRLIMICDELPELSEALVNAFYSNLSMNTEEGSECQIIGIGNFNSIFDPLGVFVKPRNGYNSISQNDDEWETETGHCIRFDALKSPNIILMEDVWPIFGNKQLEKFTAKYGDTTAEFWRMLRSFPCPAGEQHTIFSEADLSRGRVDEKPIWMETKTPVSFLDPSYTSGGDRAIAFFGHLGMTADGKMTLACDHWKDIKENLSKKDESRSYQIIAQWKELCRSFGVVPENAGYDMTGAGIVFGELVAELWSSRVHGITFGGSASDLPINASDPRPGKDAYMNKVTELWYAGLEYVHGGQIRGMDSETAKELKSRRYESVKGGSLKVRVESKEDMKKRIGKSPDIGDAFCGMLFVCRQQHGFIAGGLAGKRSVSHKSWLAKAREQDEVYSDSDDSNPLEALELANL